MAGVAERQDGRRRAREGKQSRPPQGLAGEVIHQCIPMDSWILVHVLGTWEARCPTSRT